MTQRKLASVISEIITLFRCLGWGAVERLGRWTCNLETRVQVPPWPLATVTVPRSNLRPRLCGQLVCLRPVGILNHVMFHLNYYCHYSISICVFVLYYYYTCVERKRSMKNKACFSVNCELFWWIQTLLWRFYTRFSHLYYQRSCFSYKFYCCL